MRQQSFEAARAERWHRFEAMLAALDQRRRAGPEFPHLYRLVCQDLALARQRGFSSSLVDRLHDLTLAGHQHLYGVRVSRTRPLEFLARDVPRAVRREGRLVAWMSLLFYGSALLLYWLDLREPTLVYAIMSVEQVGDFEQMYDPDAPHTGAPRDTVGDLSAFAFYVSNNVTVALRTFGWGIFCGIGSLFVLWSNAALFGVLAAHLSLEGRADTFFPFVIGHGSFELTAIVLAGAAGMKLGWPLLAPGRAARSVALRRAARETVPLLYGLVTMLLIAAVIEAFWSASEVVPASLKLLVGAGLWAVVAAWLLLGGRSRAH